MSHSANSIIDNTAEEKKITKASKTNFLYSFSFLSKEKNNALNTVYAFCRTTDDIVDVKDKSVEEKLTDLNEWREELNKAITEGDSKFELLNKLNSVINIYKIPVELFFDLINGMEMDLRISRYHTFEELAEYCYKAASNVGLMCIEIFGYRNPETKNYAVNLGIALQLTNILRDIKADAERGRIYIPLEDMRRFSYTETDLLESKYDENFIKLMEFQCSRARYFYEEANKSLSKEDKGLMFSAKIMEHIYYRILRKIERNNYNVFDRKLRVSDLRKALISFGVFIKYRLLYTFKDDRLAMQGK